MEKIETIVSLITAHGRSAVSVVRLSGADAFNMAKKLGIEGKLEHHRIYVRDISYKGKHLDKAVISVFQSPNSYTGEDVVEISVHGGSISSKRIISALIELGCRHAQRGEFTKRAFQNGKMSLIEAESVLMKVNAMTEDVFDSADAGKTSLLTFYAKSIREKLIDLKAYIQSSIDFPDDVEYDKENAKMRIDSIVKDISSLYEKSRAGYVSENHPLMIITGRTNTGKSTLFNLLLKRERAIVSDEEGTTRDIISEWADVNGHPIKILDTAGIRKTQSKAEKIGISMLNENLKSASLILFVYDIEKGLSEEEKSEIERMKDTPMVIAANKIDRAKRKKAEKEHIMISALTGEGIEKLEEAITEKLHFNEKIEITVNDRQMHIIERMCSVLLSDEISVIIKESEILDERVGELLKEIRELTGEILSENVMDNIFNNFCIGK